MDNNFTLQNISICNLVLWDENARFPDKYFLSEESDLISYFLSKPEFKIQSLAEEIIKDFDLPQLEKLVVWNNDDRNIVLEGNRRLTAYKLLVNPELAIEPKTISYFNQLKTRINITDSFEIECLVTDDKEDGFRYIDRKHANNNNEVNWQDVERAHYSVRRGSKDQVERLKVGINKIVRELDLPEPMKDQILGKKYVTNFFRVIASGPAKEKYGLSINDKGDLDIKNPNLNEELKVIVHNVLNGEDFSGKPINSRSLNKVAQIKDYIDSIKKDDVKKVNKSIITNTTENIFGDESIAIGIGNKKKILKKSTNRSYLIPQTCRLTIIENKINNIYRELRDDLLLDDSNKAVPNAVGVLFRVFLEISIDYFLEKEGVTLPKETRLAGKITKCTELMETKDIANSKQLVNIRKVATDPKSILGIQNFHDYVHSYKTTPSPNDLKCKWDNLEEFFQILWDYIHIKITSKKK
jgi:hypothetical protein